ncbi:hypothetical protein BHE74_00006273 [Ensete ventricosum]|nr:hypothetical protein BHE74_00006273 [Ensete ventricosum]
MTEMFLADQVLDLVLQVPALFGVVAVFMVETNLPLSLSLGLVLMRFGGARSPFPLIWRKILVRVELRGVVRGRGRLKASAAIKWFALYIISGTVVGGFSTRDQNSLDGRMPIRKAWTTKEGCASGIARDSVANLLTNCARGSSLPWAMPRSEATVGLSRMLARKFCSNSLVS